MINIGINGFGRIGRLVLRCIEERRLNGEKIKVVGINSRDIDNKYMIYQLKYDSVHNKCKFDISYKEKDIIINGNIIDNDTSSSDTDTEYQEVWCCSYCNKEFETENGARFHENNYCKNKYKSGYKSNNQKYYNNKPCCICGKKGHREVNCDYF